MVNDYSLDRAATLRAETVALEYLAAESSKHFFTQTFSAAAGVAHPVTRDTIAAAVTP